MTLLINTCKSCGRTGPRASGMPESVVCHMCYIPRHLEDSITDDLIQRVTTLLPIFVHPEEVKRALSVSGGDQQDALNLLLSQNTSEEKATLIKVLERRVANLIQQRNELQLIVDDIIK